MSRHRILVVDDEHDIRVVRGLMLESLGYEVKTAEHGFDALLQLKNSELPEMIISDLNMPHMSGFEFLSVLRRRFPQILVIASSGAYGAGYLPAGILADGFHAKGGGDLEGLFKMIEELFANPLERIIESHSRQVPVWIPSNGHDSNGVPFIVVTCADCLRSFPVSVTERTNQSVRETECLFCSTNLQYIIDFSRVEPSCGNEKNRNAPSLPQSEDADRRKKGCGL